MKLALDDANAEVRQAAITSLCDINNPLEESAAVRIYQVSCRDSREQVRRVAREALENARSNLRDPMMRIDHLGQSQGDQGAAALSHLEPDRAVRNHPHLTSPEF
jgi:hypothetical protein